MVDSKANGSNEHGPKNRVFNSIIVLVVASVIFFVIFEIIKSSKNVYKKSKEIKDNWAEYRCKPSVIPFVSQITGGKINTFTNGVDCLLNVHMKPYIKSILGPFVLFFESIVDVLVDVVKSIQNIKLMITYMRNTTRAFLIDIANKMHGYAKKLSYMVNRIMETFHKIFIVFEDIFYALGYLITSLASVWNGPIGDAARFICFHKNTKITMENNSYKKIKNIKTGDTIKNGGKVLATHIFWGLTSLYSYGGVIVSPSHLVYENGSWVRIGNSEKSQLLRKREKRIYCLTTEKGTMVINDILFSDYMEIKDNSDMNILMNHVSKHLDIYSPTYLCEKVWGFEKNTKIKLKNGYAKKIKNIKIGDVLEKGNIVQGVTKIYGKNVTLYEYNGIVCSGNIIFKRHTWYYMKDIGTPLKKTKKILYHIFTSDGELVINNTLYKDYNQVSNGVVHDKINKGVENKINNI